MFSTYRIPPIFKHANENKQSEGSRFYGVSRSVLVRLRGSLGGNLVRWQATNCCTPFFYFMIRLKKFFILSLLTVFYAIKINATATDVEIGGIRYTVYDNSKYAIAWNVIDGYEGDFEILDSVSYEGKMYPVTEMPQTIFYNIKIDNLYVRCHPKSYNFLSFVSKSAIIYVHGSELEKVKQYSEKNINTIEKFWISQKTEQLGAVSFELTQTPYCGNVELVSVMANNETLRHSCKYPWLKFVV